MAKIIFQYNADNENKQIFVPVANIPFELKCTVQSSDWTRRPDDKKYATKKVINLTGSALNIVYHIHLVNYCHKTEHFDIHVERVWRPTPGDKRHEYTYEEAVGEKFDLTGTPTTEGPDRNVRVFLYNSNNDPTKNNDEYLWICNVDPATIPEEDRVKVKYPDPRKAFPIAASADPSDQPETESGNIIVGKG
ncbi:hypothetical protein POV27_19390 [Aureisphaera galaxeae]|uniref:hypothetical protein n=1 Tax=Aureisphaera galaxeae TaxID=1538023 RepID=UPI0023504AAA|nr:hypothetical protein [Aureisphaera galaxeae]MDC8006226.1 hypothetical protein [Aureisphaera galaxeae]